MIRKAYAETEHGQVHVRMLEPDGAASRPPLVCLHPAPSSGLYFATAMPLLNKNRRVLAPDYPGYGGSDPVGDSPTVSTYAEAMWQALDALGVGDTVDILGFHSGCLVGVDMTLQRGSGVRRLVLCDVPYFTGDSQRDLAQKMSVPMPLGPELESIAGPWKFNIASRLGDVSLPRAVELFAEHMRAGSDDAKGFNAAFSYDCEANFAKLHADVVVLATQSGLHAPSLAAADIIADAELVDVTEVSSAVFESGAEAIAARINAALDNNHD